MGGGPWQLVEVSASKVAPTRSQHGSPVLPLLRSPLTKPAAGPARWSDAEDLQLLEPEDRARTASPLPHEATSAASNDGAWPRGPGSAAGGNDDLDPQYFVGDWIDNLGHGIVVSAARRRGGGPGGRFLAVLQKPGVPDKCFTISKDRGRTEWTCGNGRLVRDESGPQELVWRAEDGRTSSWWRAEAGQWQAGSDNNGPAAQHLYYVLPDAAGELPHHLLEWKEFRLPMDDDDEVQQKASDRPGGNSEAPSQVVASRLNPSAAEFVPSSLTQPRPASPLVSKSSPSSKPTVWPAARHRASPELRAAASPVLQPRWGRTPTPSPTLRPAAWPPLVPPLVPPSTALAAPLPQVHLCEEAVDITVAGNRLEWCLPHVWGDLDHRPKDFSVTSPTFGVRHATGMQLAFYPNGHRVAEDDHCTVALIREPNCAGIKFEILVNGRGIGPKVCLGRKYLGDYPKPFDSSQESKQSTVVVYMQVLEILGAAD